MGIARFSRKVRGTPESGSAWADTGTRETRDFGDLGRHLGRALRQLLDVGALPWRLMPAGEGIRATALGASEHSVQISGQTIFISDHASLLPVRNLRVISPPVQFGATIDTDSLARAISAHRVVSDAMEARSPLALAFKWRGSPDYARIRALADAIALAMADHIRLRLPLYLMLEGDAALNLGAVLRDELKIESEVLVIDGVVLRDFDFVDIGRLRLPSHIVPVTIKSLLFGSAGAPRI